MMAGTTATAPAKASRFSGVALSRPSPTQIITPKTIEEKIDELAVLPEVTLNAAEIARIAEIGNNKGCMELKGGNPAHSGDPLPDRWPLNDELLEIASRWKIEPARDLVCTHGKAE